MTDKHIRHKRHMEKETKELLLNAATGLILAISLLVILGMLDT